MLALLTAFFLSLPAARPAQSPEYELKAAFLFNFAQFVEWPPSAFASTNSPLVIGLWGNDPFGKSLDDLVHGESVRGHPLEIRHVRGADDLAGVQVLFIARSEQNRLPGILRSVGKKPVLTVSDIDRFAERGGMIGMVMVANKVRFKINQDEAKSSGLQLNARLLRLAEITRTKEDRL